MLPAREGDCLWLRYGSPKKPRQVLIDGGRAATTRYLKARFAALPAGERDFELLIITHVDRDHIEGILKLLEEREPPVSFRDVWFNGFHHLQNATQEEFGAVQGERLSRILRRQFAWNRALRGGPICIGTKGVKKIRLPGGLRLTLLSPDRTKLANMIPIWRQECRKAGLIAGAAARASEPRSRFEAFGVIDVGRLAMSRFESDPGAPNGSSIAVLAEYRGKRALLAGDAHVDRLMASIRQLKGSSKRLRIDAVKLAHHGSERNVSAELVKMIHCRHYLISTNGAYFRHPAAAAIARVVAFAGANLTLHFNYRSTFTLAWNAKHLKDRYEYAVEYPSAARNGALKVSL